MGQVLSYVLCTFGVHLLQFWRVLCVVPLRNIINCGLVPPKAGTFPFFQDSNQSTTLCYGTFLLPSACGQQSVWCCMKRRVRRLVVVIVAE